MSVNYYVQSPCCDFQISQGSQIELTRTRRFLEHGTQTTELVSPVRTTDVLLPQKTLQPLPWTAPSLRKHVGAPSMRPWFQSNVVLPSTLLRKGLNSSPCSSHSQSMRASSLSSWTVSARFVHAFVLRTFSLAPWSGPAASECDA